MKRFINAHKKAVGAVVAVAIVAGSGIGAYAYWSSSGSGTGSASTQTADSSLSITDNSASFTSMYPGDTAQSIVVTVENTSSNGQKEYVAGVKAYLTVAQEASPPAGTCDSTDYLLNGSPAGGTAATATALHWTAQDLSPGVAGEKSTSGADNIHFNDKGTLQDACQGATVTLHYVSN